MSQIGQRVLIGSIVAAVALTIYYVRAIGGMEGLPSGRTAVGFNLGIAGTVAMAVAAFYSWRRRFIAAASRPIAVTAEARKDLLAREKIALEQLQALQRALLRNPKTPVKEIRAEARAIVKSNKVRRTIQVNVVAPTGMAPRLEVGRREWAGRLQTWYLAHLSLGCLSLLLILFHSGFRFGNVIATLAFLCLLGVVVTGILGVWLYWTIPPRLTVIEERAELTPEELREEHRSVVDELDAVAEGKSPGFQKVYHQETSIPDVSMEPSLRWLTAPAAIERDTSRPDRLRLIVREIPPSEQEDFRRAMRLIFRKEKIEVSLYPQLRYDYLLKIWLTAHIPLSAGMWGFSIVHIVSVFYY